VDLFCRRGITYTRLINLISLVLALFLVGNVQAQDAATWTDAIGDHNWFTPGNWSEFPTDAHWAKIRNGPPGPTIASEGAVAYRVHVGYSEGGVLTVDGGTLVISPDDLRLGKNGGSGILNMISGSISIARDLDVGHGDPGIVNMTGGTITVSRDLEMPDEAGSTAEMNLDGGTISLGDDLSMGEGGTMNIRAGTLIIDGDEVSRVQGYIDNGWITAYEGNGTLQLDYDVTNEGKTTLKAVHVLNPNPLPGSAVFATVNQLQWTLPEPNQPGGVVTCDVYFGTDPIAENNPKVVDRQAVESVSVTLAPSTVYYWTLDLYDSSISDTVPFMLAPRFTFNTINPPPIVNAGADAMTWLDNGSVDVALAGAVTDTDPTTTVWTVVSQPDDPNSPDAAIADAAALNTSITLSAPGEYVLRLEADDGESTGSDTVTINVYSDSCEAAQSLPDYVPLVGDVNADCVVDARDLALMAMSWLEDNSL